MDDVEVLMKSNVIRVARELRKFPHEVEDEMDTDEFAEVLGFIMAGNIEQQEAAPKGSATRGPRPLTMGG